MRSGAQTIRALATIGKAAVPELVAELDRTDRDATLRSLAFCLRDRRSAGRTGVDPCDPKGTAPAWFRLRRQHPDPDLRTFMKAHQNYKDDKANHVACGRPVNEIITRAREDHQAPRAPRRGRDDRLRHVFLREPPRSQSPTAGAFRATSEALAGVVVGTLAGIRHPGGITFGRAAKRTEDLVELAGVARYGTLFPTGQQSTRSDPNVAADPAGILERKIVSRLRHRTGFTGYEGTKWTDWGQPAESGSRIITWYRRNGIDVRCQGPIEGVDLQLWLIDDKSMGDPRGGNPEGRAVAARHGSNRFVGTFRRNEDRLQVRRTGDVPVYNSRVDAASSRCSQKIKDADRFRLRYRMWVTGSGGQRPADGRQTGR